MLKFNLLFESSKVASTFFLHILDSNLLVQAEELGRLEVCKLLRGNQCLSPLLIEKFVSKIFGSGCGKCVLNEVCLQP